MRSVPCLLLFLCLGYSADGKNAGACKMGTSHQKDTYPPQNGLEPVTWFQIDLDAPALTRWTHVVQPQTAAIVKLTNIIVKTLRTVLGGSLVDKVIRGADDRLDKYTAVLPGDMGDEIKGIAAATGIDPAVIFMYNIFYTVFGACTSIVAEGPTKIAARNLDFGLWPAFNLSDGNLWELTEALRPLVINVDMQRNGTSLYKATTYAGFIGMHTAVRPGVMSLTIDSRFDTHIDAGLLKWLAFPKLDHGVEVTMAARAALENSDSYEAGFEAINSTRVLGPSYLILGGPGKGQGAVLTKGATGLLKPEGETIAVVTLADQMKSGSSFLVQTNYDGDADGSKPASKIDNRRDPAKACMTNLGVNGSTFAGIYGLLSSTPNLNRLTTYTTLMEVKSGKLETYRQKCETMDCPLF